MLLAVTSKSLAMLMISVIVVRAPQISSLGMERVFTGETCVYANSATNEQPNISVHHSIHIRHPVDQYETKW